ncbi:hypothetical protein KO500_14805 [Cellulophaga baltica]|nr:MULTISPECIES: hypothetical protein [Cellulophaga]MBU2997717.1 hypothetical protein [Cellulophaga baltica]MDO6769112.1 hypothetical protein [Cellulophaga sp. 1_MG-2023]
MNNNKQNYQTNSKIGSTWTTDENLSSLKKEFLLDRVINNSVTGYISD